ncbi:hypothetical protein CCACVL1_09666 [Corchorus capsularis]|uniref:TRF2/HOY1 PH-like domain-containing protein n=1 Tax=Corchorus capsularis TaxID=210143 RepID=A0A1R3IUK3_COCAP|nr:hypothetical protein CCACVL1_09666 [Corchorus capsularis]
MEQTVLSLEEDHMEEVPLMSSPQSFDSLSGSSSRIQSTPPQLLVINSNQGLEAIQHLPALGLKLSRTPSFMDKLERLARKQNSRAHDHHQEVANYNSGNYATTTKVKSSKDISNKLKAENFSISLLKVGSWQRVTRNEGDLIAKFYFAKRKLVWEILEKGLKSKIEIQWSEILSLKAILLEDRPGILQIELNQPPSFHHEIDPQPRKHTQWRMASDFTGGQALTFRRHYLEFPCGVLDKPLEKLLSCDSRLFQISRQGFPATNSPYFQPQTNGNIGFSLDFGGHNHHQQFSFSHYVPQHYQTYDHQQKSLNKDSPISDEQSSNNQMSLWSQGMNNVRDSLIINQVGSAMAAAAPNIPQVTSLPSNHMQQLAGGLLPTHSLQEADDQSQSRFQSLLNDVQEMLMSNSQAELSNPTGNNVIAAGYGHETMVMNNNWSSNIPQLPSWQAPPPQPDQINPFCCPSGVSNDPSREYFPSANSFNNEVNDWSWRSG